MSTVVGVPKEIKDMEGRVSMHCVANIPGAVARTSTLALISATLTYLIRIADKDLEGLSDTSQERVLG